MATHTYIFMRHGEADHNVAAAGSEGNKAYENPAYRDAPLTAKGREQILESARELQKTYPKIDLILSSPLTRAIQTARCTTEVIPCPQKIILMEALTECQGGNHICNLRQPMPLLQDLNPDVDASLMNPNASAFYTEEYALKRPRENTTTMQWRAHTFLTILQSRLQKWLPSKQSSTVLIVSHHETLNAWFGKSLKNGETIIVKDLKEVKTPNAAYTWR